MKFKELAMLLQVPKEQRDELRKVLESLELEGKIYLSKKGCVFYTKGIQNIFFSIDTKHRL